MKKIGIVLVIVLVLAACGAVAVFMMDSKAPETVLTPKEGYVSAKTEFKITASDQGSGLSELQISAVQGDAETPVLREKFAAKEKNMERTFNLGEMKLKEGPLVLRVKVSDRSLANWGNGNVFKQDFQYTVDSKPPIVSLLTHVHNINQGGCAIAVYNISKPVAKSGVQAGDHFFPGFRQEAGYYLCVFSFPWNMPLKDFRPKLVAVDDAGNSREVWLPFHANARVFRDDKINVSDAFLDNVTPQFQSLYPDAKDPLEVYVRANRDLRAQNVRDLTAIGQKTSPTPMWSGEFLRQPNAAPRAGFADHRTYLYKGKEIDQQTHMGVDLASLEHAEVPAANAGRVVFTGMLGIYGQAIIIDHGLGVMSIYGHLSAINTEDGKNVKKGEIIGHTGMTGMAGGDHLHYEMMVSGVPVTPIEWWDTHWIKDNVGGRLSGQGS